MIFEMNSFPLHFTYFWLCIMYVTAVRGTAKYWNGKSFLHLHQLDHVVTKTLQYISKDWPQFKRRVTTTCSFDHGRQCGCRRSLGNESTGNKSAAGSGSYPRSSFLDVR